MKDAEATPMYIYTEDFDQFTTFFYGDRVFLSRHEMPLGQNTVDMLNVDEQIVTELERRAEKVAPAVRRMLEEKTDSAIASAQETLNAVWDIVFKLPVYCTLNMDYDLAYHLFFVLRADQEKWEQVFDESSEDHQRFIGLLLRIACLAPQLIYFRKQVTIMADQYFELEERRNSAAYAKAFAFFYTDMMQAHVAKLGEEFEQAFSMEVNFVPMMHPTEAGRVFVAEKARFNDLTNFLRVEFYRALAIGNAPRRCHNCGKYFLLTAGYSTCYCNNIAPGETERTCRKVGAHRKAEKIKASQTPAQKEYDKAYNRLKARKQRGKISIDEWNAAVVQAQELKAQAERGKLSDEELRRKLAAL